MNNNDLVINDSEKLDDSLNIPEAHPVLVITFGTTMAELAVVLHAQNNGMPNLVPWRVLAVDSLQYQGVVTQLVQNGYTEKQVAAAIPRSHYFHLTSPFSEDFNFDNPLNEPWLTTIFEPALRRLASKPNAPGCAGTPALGRARVEGNEQDLQDFFEEHLLQLTKVRTKTLAILEGVKVFVITTYRGGTGTGATMTGGAVLKSVLDNGSTIHLHTIMPCVYASDERAYANAYAMLRESQWYHHFEGGVPMKGARILKAPFDSTTYTFVSNGAVTLGHMDALMQEAGILRSYIRVPTQAAINAREVDLTDVIPHDLEDKPMHVRIETAISIRTVQPGTLQYMVTEWVRQELEEVRDSFEAWCQAGTLPTNEESRLKNLVENTIKELNLELNALLNWLDPSPAPTNAIRSFFENANSMIGSMDADAIKQSIAGLPQQVRDAFLKFEGSWEDKARQLAVSLPQKVSEYVMSKMATSPHLYLAALSKVSDYLTGLSKEAAKGAESEKQKRDTNGTQLGAALNAVQEAKGILGFINADEVTRDAAHKACSIAMIAALARAQQQRFEYLVQVLEGEMSSLDRHGKAVTISSVTASLRNIQVENMAEIRKKQASQVEALKTRLDDLSQQIEKRSQVFQRALLYDGMSRQELDQMVQKVRASIPEAPSIVKFLEGKQELTTTLEELMPLLPSYPESIKSLTDIVTEDPANRNLVVQLLRNRKPFTTIDKEVEEQQSLRNRRDTLVIFDLPGGKEGLLAELLTHEGIVTNPNQVVDSGDDEIRMYYLRDGLPYAAIRPMAKYQQRHDSYIAKPGAMTPNTVSGAQNFPGLEPSQTNLRRHTEEILYKAKAVLPHRVTPKPSGGFTLSYEKDTDQAFTIPEEENFRDFDSMANWLAKQVKIRKKLEAELDEHLNTKTAAHKESLVATWQQAAGKERDHLQYALFRLGVNPHQLANPTSGHKS